MRILISTALVGTLLAACSISGGSSGEPVPTTVSRNTPAVSWGCTDDFCGISYTEGVLELADLPKDADLAYGAFEGAGSSSGEMLFAVERLALGPGYSSTVSVALIRDEFGGTGVLYGRDFLSELPAGDTGYSGDYVGLVTNAANDNVIYVINGDASLSFDFGISSVLGAVGNRTVLGPSGDAAIGVTAGDVLMIGTVNSQGLFSGVTEGGDISAMSVTDAQDGTFDGLIAGPDGFWVVGGLDFVHSRTGDDYLETGAFYLED